MNSDRRALLRTVVGVGTVGLAGCGSRDAGGPGGDGTPTPTDSPEPTATPASNLPEDVVRCRGDPVSVERSVSAEAEGIEYFPSNETIKYPALMSGGEVAEYGTMPVDHWVVIETAEAVHDPVRQAVRDRLGTEVGSGLSRAPDAGEGPSLCVWLHAIDPEALEGTRTPRVTLSELAEAAPRSGNATVSLDGETFSREVPVFAELRAPARPA